MPLNAEVAPSRRTLAVAAALVAANLALFVLIAEDLLEGGGLIAHDESVLAWFVDHRTDRWIRVAKLMSTIGAFVSLTIIGVLLGVWLWRRGSQAMLAAAPLASLLLASLASTVAKSIFDRDRPPVTVHATTVTLAAFPSGHATDAAAFSSPPDSRSPSRSLTTGGFKDCWSRLDCSSPHSSVSADSCSASTGFRTSSPAGRSAVRLPSPSWSPSGTSRRGARPTADTRHMPVSLIPAWLGVPAGWREGR